MVIVSTNRSK